MSDYERKMAGTVAAAGVAKAAAKAAATAAKAAPTGKPTGKAPAIASKTVATEKRPAASEDVDVDVPTGGKLFKVSAIDSLIKKDEAQTRSEHAFKSLISSRVRSTAARSGHSDDDCRKLGCIGYDKAGAFHKLYGLK